MVTKAKSEFYSSMVEKDQKNKTEIAKSGRMRKKKEKGRKKYK